MSIVSFQDVHVGFGAQIVLEGVDWQIQRGEKVGLVGPNGSGKTTLFKLMLNQLHPSMGTVTSSRGLQMAYLSQDPQLDSQRSLYDEVSSTFANVQRLEERVAEVATLIAEHHETDQADELMQEYDELTHRLEAAGGYRYEVLLNEVLGGLGFSPDDYELPISALSGGQKNRAALAKLLLQEADLLLLDEPTNHLDINATRFLEKFLAGYHGAAVIVSHDRYLLDRVVDKIADLDQKRITVYPCAYSDYVESKQIRQLTEQRAFEKQQEWIKHQREYAERVKADKSRSKQARGRLLHLDRMEKTGRVLDRPTQHKRRMALDIAPSQRGGDIVLRCEGLRKAYGDVVLFDDFEFEVFRGEKTGIVGPNGVGKTTLLKMAMRRLEPDDGTIRLYENLDVGYYDQEHADLNHDHRVIDEIQEHRTAAEEGRIRTFLAQFLFTGDDPFKWVRDLSGGEQSRVVLAKLVWQRPQVLILDEPTNHLDIPSKEVLEEALLSYDGAILMVSHDRYFLNRVINRLLILPRRGEYEIIPGNWSTYEQKLADEEAAARKAAQQAEGKPRGKRAKRSKSSQPSGPTVDVDSPYANWSLEEVEGAIVERESQLEEAEARFADPEIYRDADRTRELRAAADALRGELAELNRVWEAHAEQAE